LGDRSINDDAHANDGVSGELAQLFIRQGDATVCPVERRVNGHAAATDAVNSDAAAEDRSLGRQMSSANRFDDGIAVLVRQTTVAHRLLSMLGRWVIELEEGDEAPGSANARDAKAAARRRAITVVMNRRDAASAKGDIGVLGEMAPVGGIDRERTGRCVHQRPVVAILRAGIDAQRSRDKGDKGEYREERRSLGTATVFVVRHVFLLLAALSSLNGASAATFALSADGSTVIGEVRVVLPLADNTLLDIARHFDIGYEEMVAANPGVSVWTPGAGTRVVVPGRFILPQKPWQGIVINIPQRRFYYFPPPRQGESRQVITYPVSIAREGWATPLGQTRIVAKYRDPGWFVPKSIWVENLLDDDVELPEYFPPGPDNPMGMLALRTGFPGIFIHATNRPWGVGMRTSHGCIHLYPEDAAELFPLVQVGVAVRFIDKPFLVGTDRGRLVMASFAPVAEYASSDSAEDRAFQALHEFMVAGDVQGVVDRIDWSRINRLISTPQPVPVAVTNDQPDLEKELGVLIPLPYDRRPYGSDANNAEIPGKMPSEQ
jgi:L,D-transpeptidase ErfK/SrfK